MNVPDTPSHDERSICQIWYANIKANISRGLDTKTSQKPLKLTLRPKVNVESGSWMFATHPFMMIDVCAKYGKPMSNKKIEMDQKQKHVKHSKVNVVLGSRKYATHCFMVMHPCAKYGKLMANPKESYGPDPKNPLNLTLRSRVNYISGSWICGNHCRNVIHPCTKYGMQKSNQ